MLLKTPLIILLLLFHLVVYLATGQPRFVKLDPTTSGIDFTNTVIESDSLHVLKYEYLYNGHGVGVGDFNADGLPDLFFSGNMVPSRLYLNTGKMTFRDITSAAGIAFNGTWATGVSIADVNADGLPDIYVSHSGPFSDSLKLTNELLINTGIRNGVPTFEDSAAAYGLDAPGTQSTQAAFFDYDRDGDLDMFLVNHSNHTVNPLLNTKKIRSLPDMHFGNRLFRHDITNNKHSFTDVTLSAGIINNALNFGLSVSVSDLNNDGWPDLYTTSDYTETDCFYLNNKKGGFTENLRKSFAHVSKYSMGSDIADYNNDGLLDVLTLDMLPEDNYRQKLLKGPDEYDQYQLLIDSGYYHQQMRNMLHLNMGADQDGNIRFSEIGQLAGVSNTDWSWAGLFADLDNDGWKDLFITNGYLRDFTNLDFLKYTVSNAQMEEAKKGNFNFKTFELVRKMPSNKLSSYVFRNAGDLTFSDVTTPWGLQELSVSNGAAYADLDNDGDLDLVVCRNNEPVALYDNRNVSGGNHFLKLKLVGPAGNTAALGSRVYVYAAGLRQVQENYPVRGYQSCMGDELLFGLSGATSADSLVVLWPDGKMEYHKRLAADSTHYLHYANPSAYKKQSAGLFSSSSKNQLAGVSAAAAERQYAKIPESKHALMFTDVTSATGIDFRHKENQFIDFKDEVLLPYQLSREGPALASADVNGDGLDDFYIGGAIEQPGVLYIQQRDGRFIPSAHAPWQLDAACEDVDAVFLDVDNDHDADLYVVSGGNEYGEGSPEYQDRLYINNGNAEFIKAAGSLPEMTGSKQTVAAADFDKDGDTDLFVGGKAAPGSFPLAARSYLLENRSAADKAVFVDVTESVCPALLRPGMVSSASWTDFDRDGYPELVIGGDWMPVLFFRNAKGKLMDASATAGFAKTSGMWASITVTDYDGDGDDDIIAGNAGKNLPFGVTGERPMEMFVGDFDNNQRIDPLICYYVQDKSYPMASRDELLDQVTPLKKKFVYYKDFANATARDIYSDKQLKAADTLICETLESSVFLNKENFFFSRLTLPVECQFSRVSAIVADDLDNDGWKDIVLAGNFFPYSVRLGRNDASVGVLLQGGPGNKYQQVPPYVSGLFASGDVRRIVLLKTAEGRSLLIAKNDDHIQMIKIK